VPQRGDAARATNHVQPLKQIIGRTALDDDRCIAVAKVVLQLINQLTQGLDAD
jgi:hypothetical protein